MRLLERIVTTLFILSLLAYGGTRFYNAKYVDRVAPVIGFSAEGEIQASIHVSNAELLKDVYATDNKDGDISNQIIVKNISPLITADTAKVYYVVFDKANNMGTASRIIRYTDYEKPQFALNEPLIFAPGDIISFMDRLTATDIVDGDISDRIRVTMKTATSYEGVINTTVQVTNSMGDTSILPLRVIVSNAQSVFQPVKLTQYIDYIDVGSSFDPLSYIASAEDEDGKEFPISSIRISSDVNPAEEGNYLVTYTKELNGTPYNVFLAVVVK